MFRAPFGASRRRGGFGDVRQGETIRVAGQSYEHVSQAAIPTGQVPGVELTLYILTPGPLPLQTALDYSVRNTLANLGYSVGASTLEATRLVFSWAKADDWYYARISQGPAELVAVGRDYKTTGADTPTPKDLVGLPVTAVKYTVLARPIDGLIDSAKVQNLLAALRTLTTRDLLAEPMPGGVGLGAGASVETFVKVRGVEAGKSWLAAGFGLAGVVGLLALYYEKKKGKLRPSGGLGNLFDVERIILESMLAKGQVSPKKYKDRKRELDQMERESMRPPPR